MTEEDIIEYYDAALEKIVQSLPDACRASRCWGCGNKNGELDVQTILTEIRYSGKNYVWCHHCRNNFLRPQQNKIEVDSYNSKVVLEKDCFTCDRKEVHGEIKHKDFPFISFSICSQCLSAREDERKTMFITSLERSTKGFWELDPKKRLYLSRTIKKAALVDLTPPPPEFPQRSIDSSLNFEEKYVDEWLLLLEKVLPHVTIIDESMFNPFGSFFNWLPVHYNQKPRIFTLIETSEKNNGRISIGKISSDEENPSLTLRVVFNSYDEFSCGVIEHVLSQMKTEKKAALVDEFLENEICP